MAFSPDQVEIIKMYLGYPQIIISDLESILVTIGEDATKQALVELQLTKLEAIEDSIAEATQAAGIKKADEVEFFNASGQISGYIQQGKRFINRLATLLNYSVAADYYSTASGQTNLMLIG